MLTFHATHYALWVFGTVCGTNNNPYPALVYFLSSFAFEFESPVIEFPNGHDFKVFYYCATSTAIKITSKSISLDASDII